MTAENPDKKEITAPDYIRANFDPSDRLAVLVRNRRRGDTLQRISTAVRIAAPQFQDWLRYKNERDGSDIYLGMNPLKPEAHTRTKDDIQAIKHLYIDLDHEGTKSLAAIQQSDLVPTPSYVLSTSPDKFQVIWRVEGVTQEQAEAFLHALAREFDGDPAATDSTRVLRLPGFANKKYEEDFQVIVHAHTDRTYHARDFRASHRSSGLWPRKMESVSRAHCSFRPSRVKPIGARLGLRQACPGKRTPARRGHARHCRVPGAREVRPRGLCPAHSYQGPS